MKRKTHTPIRAAAAALIAAVALPMTAIGTPSSMAASAEIGAHTLAADSPLGTALAEVTGSGEGGLLPAATPALPAAPKLGDGLSVGAAEVKMTGHETNAWGRTAPQTKVWTEVQLPNGSWSRSQIRISGSDGQYVIPLTYGTNSAGTYRWRVRTNHATTPAWTLTRTGYRAGHADTKRVGEETFTWGQIPTANNRRVRTQVKLPNGSWSQSQVRRADSNGRFQIPLTYGRYNSGTTTWRVVADTRYGTLTSNEWTLTRTGSAPAVPRTTSRPASAAPTTSRPASAAPTTSRPAPALSSGSTISGTSECKSVWREAQRYLPAPPNTEMTCGAVSWGRGVSQSWFYTDDSRAYGEVRIDLRKMNSRKQALGLAAHELAHQWEEHGTKSQRANHYRILGTSASGYNAGSYFYRPSEKFAAAASRCLVGWTQSGYGQMSCSTFNSAMGALR